MIQIALGELIKITLRIDTWNNRQPKQNKRFAIKPHRSFFGASSQPRNTFSRLDANVWRLNSGTTQLLLTGRQGIRGASIQNTTPLKFLSGTAKSSGLAHGNQPEIIQHVLPILEKHHVQAYFAGHDHDLEHLKLGHLHLIVSGAGSEHRPMKSPATSPFSRACSGFVMAYETRIASIWSSQRAQETLKIANF
jgi:hypothetical protein